jgi:malate/lactate dehydrogenase
MDLSKVAINEPKQSLYLYREDMDRTMMVSMMPLSEIGKGRHSCMEMLYNPLEDRGEMIVAINLNWFEHKFGNIDMDSIIQFLARKKAFVNKKKKVTLLALGDVGSTLAIGLKLLGGEVIESLGICDIDEAQKKRWEMELNQIVLNPDLKILPIEIEALFDSDLFIFCASKFVPKVGDEKRDVRMIQFEENSKLISHYAKMARAKKFEGIFAVVSDPVDLLCRKAFEASNQNELMIEDHDGLLPEQVVGFGLGVMDGRAKYYSDILGFEYRENGRVFGPHGKDLVVASNVRDENQENSILLTSKVVSANLEMRALGYKPYVAPALSSGAYSILAFISGESHFSAHFLEGVYWGTRNRLNEYGVEMEHIKLSSSLRERVQKSYEILEETWQELNA